ncbi:Tfp pilus assembly protein PilF [Parafrankia irregularis]|uniref:Tfp pilus assembly protein PilF n=1 Tax=Parafrankia irregularis TaxID=795642 RepID=A0A0S4QTF2_9ACTN|nr:MULTISPECIES: tetratricopeptide repeat protein [Parafrankia]MBE3205931.1 tetratricopeptide repeat protein [Parafrankia sp. CH37]CUU58120.1 Tfp pilus assembly protein PilF [Parafrankia irregularis]
MIEAEATSPYVGLRPFTEEDSELFFGRDAAAHALLAEWLRCRVVVAHGLTGVGKTSLLRAGVLPSAPSTDADVLPVARPSGPTGQSSEEEHEPAGSQASFGAGNPFVQALLRCWSSPTDTPTLLDAIRDHPARRRPHSSTRPILVAIDQVEEFFAARSAQLAQLDQLRTQCFDLLAQAAAALPTLRILLVVRSDHRATLEPYLRLLLAGSGGGPATPSVAEVPVAALEPRSAQAALVEPLRATGTHFASGAAEACVDDLATSRFVDATGAESLLVANAIQPVFLQLVATAMWRARPGADAVITSRLGPAGNVTAVLAEYLTLVLVTVAREHDLDEGELRAWLTRTFVTERGRRGVADEGLTTTAGLPTAVLESLTARYVLRCEHRSGSRRFELFDDRLIEPLQRGFPEWAVSGTAAEANADDHLRAAQVSFADHDLPTARTHVEEALRRDPGRSLTRAGAQTLRAQMCEMQGRWQDAEACYREAAEIYESLSDTESSGRMLAALGRVLLESGQTTRAIEDLQAASERLPGDAEVQAALAHALWRTGQPWAAAAIFSAVLTFAPDSGAALAGRARLRVELGDDAAAMQDFERLARSAAQVVAQPSMRAARAVALARRGQVAEAANESSVALREAPDSGPVLWHAAEVIRARGDDEGADGLLRRALDAAEPALLPHQQSQVLRLLRRSGAMA